MNPTFNLAGQVVFGLLLAVFVLALVRRDDSLTTAFYGPVMVAATAFTYFIDGQFTTRQILIHFLVAFWGLRLGVHLFIKNSDRGLDWRLSRGRERGGSGFFLNGLIRGFLLQGVVSMLVLTPVLLVMGDPAGPVTPRDWFGVLLWLVGFSIESVADNELLAWKKVPGQEGHLVTTGPWRFSRHPNYFGEVLVWWGIFLVGLGAKGGWWGIVSPLTVTALILFVTGIPMAERKFLNHPEWKDYAARTSVFIPWFPGKEK